MHIFTESSICAAVPQGFKTGNKFDAKNDEKNIKKEWKTGCEITLILEGTFFRILVLTCLHFGPQVEVQKVRRIEFKFKISARGFQESPRASQERPKRVQERPKSGPRAPQGAPRAFPERPKRVQVTPKTVPGAPKSSQDSKIKVAPYKNTGKGKKKYPTLTKI